MGTAPTTDRLTPQRAGDLKTICPDGGLEIVATGSRATTVAAAGPHAPAPGR